jgi:hypothetical protein
MPSLKDPIEIEVLEGFDEALRVPVEDDGSSL